MVVNVLKTPNNILSILPKHRFFKKNDRFFTDFQPGFSFFIISDPKFFF
jgi:hypothetical protein